MFSIARLGFRRRIHLAGAAAAPLRPLRDLRASRARPNEGRGGGSPRAVQAPGALGHESLPSVCFPGFDPMLTSAYFLGPPPFGIAMRKDCGEF